MITQALAVLAEYAAVVRTRPWCQDNPPKFARRVVMGISPLLPFLLHGLIPWTRFFPFVTHL